MKKTNKGKKILESVLKKPIGKKKVQHLATAGVVTDPTLDDDVNDINSDFIKNNAKIPSAGTGGTANAGVYGTAASTAFNLSSDAINPDKKGMPTIGGSAAKLGLKRMGQVAPVAAGLATVPVVGWAGAAILEGAAGVEGAIEGGVGASKKQKRLRALQEQDTADKGSANMVTEAAKGGFKHGGSLTAAKAKQMIKDNSAQGHRLSKKQKAYFGFIAGGGKADGGNIGDPPNVDSTFTANKNVPFVQKILSGDTTSIQVPGKDGRSTHLLSQVDNYVYPQVQVVDGKLTYFPDWKDAWANAKKTNNVIKFKTDADALNFTNQYKNSDVWKKFSDKGGYEKGGEIVGKGTAKSDSISADLHKNGFVVPAENAKAAAELGKSYLGHKEDQMAKLKAGGTPVKVSDGEYYFTPKEVRKLSLLGYDLNKMAPNADTKIKKGAGLANGNPVTYPNGVKINPDNAGSETVYEKQDIDGKTYMVGYNVDKKTGAKNIVDVRDEDGLLYDDVTADSTGKLKSVEATTGKTDKWTDANKTKYAGITDYTTDDKTTTTPSEYTTPHYDKATGMIIMPDGSKRDRSGRLWVEPTLSQGEKIGSWMADDDTKTYRQQFKDNNFYRSAADTQAGSERAQAIADGTLNADGTPITSAATTPVTSTDKTAAKSNKAASWIGTTLGAAQVGLGATALISDHYNQPDDYDVDPNVAADAARARTAAAFGLEGNDLDMATKSIEAKRRMTAANIINASRGSGAVALSNMQKGTNLANEGMNKLASYDTATKMKKEAYADTLDKVIAKMRQKKSDDAWSAWSENEKSGAKLLQAGINNVIGAQKYKAMLDAQKARAVTNNSSDWWSASTTTPTQTY